MRIVKRLFFIAFILSAAVVSNCFADYIADIPTETIDGNIVCPLRTFPYKYDIGFSNLEMNITLKLYERGLDPASSLAQFWEAGIENTWSHKFDIVDRDFHYHINFDVVFYSEMSSLVHSQINWDPASTGRDVAHETGHLFGLYDEYDGDWANPSDPIIDSSSIMGDLGSTVYDRHYYAFLNWLQLQPAADGRRLFLVEYDPSQVPEPATILLLTLGVMLQRKTAKYAKV